MDVITEFEKPVDEALLRGDEPSVDDDQEENLAAVEVEQDADEKEPESAAPATEKEADPQRSQHIPRERFDEVNTRLKEERALREDLEAKIAAMQSLPAAEKEQPVDLKALLKDYNTALIDGDEEKAQVLGEQIEEERYRRAEEAADRRAEAKISEREQRREKQDAMTEFNKKVTDILGQYPQLDSSYPEKDDEAIGEVVEWRDFYMAKGVSPSLALEKAVKKVVGGLGEQKEGPTVKVDPRKEQQAKVNADTANRQPPVLRGAGNRSISTKGGVPDNQDEYEKIPLAERKKLLQ